MEKQRYSRINTKSKFEIINFIPANELSSKTYQLCELKNNYGLLKT